MRGKTGKTGAALAASLAVSLAMVTGAQAVQFHSAEAHTILTAKQSTTHVFTAGSGFGGITCTTAEFAGTTASATETERTITPTYSGCKDTFGRTAHINLNSCKIRSHATSGSGTTYTGNVDIVGCSAPATVTITPGGLLGECKVTVGEQENVGPIAFHNVANGDVKVDSSANNAVNTTSGGVFNCGISNGVHNQGTYSGDGVGAGTSTAGGAVNVFVG